MFCRGWLVDPYPLGVVYCKTWYLYRKVQFIGNVTITQYFVAVVGQHCQWLEFHIKIHGVAGKQCVFSVQKAGNRSLFSETLA